MGKKSIFLYKRAIKVIPGGVNSPVRAFGSVGGNPIFVKKGKKQYIWTVDDDKLVDFCSSWGAIILGHSHKKVLAKVIKTIKDGSSFGINTAREVKFAELLCSIVPDIEMIRLVNSGTEAVMTAIRLARAFTKRLKIIKFEGCYHGHYDSMLVAAGSGLLTSGIASSAGIPDSVAKDTLVLPYNNIEAVREAIKTYKEQIAAIIIEPIACNMGVVLPIDSFLKELRAITRKENILLIFDEVITGFRLAPTTYAATIGIKPDLYTLGKIIGGGFPIGAIAGRKEIMQLLAPIGKVYQAGTLSGNPVAVAAGYETLKILLDKNPYDELAAKGKIIANGLNGLAAKYGIKLRCNHIGGIFTPFFTDREVMDLTTAKSSDTNAYGFFFRALLKAGFYLPPSQFEASFISMAHINKDIELFLKSARKIFESWKVK